MNKKHKRIKKMQRNILILISIIAVLLLALFFSGSITETIEKNKIQQANAEEEAQIEDLKDCMKIESISIVGRATGTGPFTEAEDGNIPEVPAPGEDYTDSDSYVRTFDVVKYNLNVSVIPNTDKEGVTDSSTFYGGIIKVRAKLPNQGDNVNLTWERDAWMQNVQLSEDKTEIYAEYQIPSTQVSCPNLQSLSFTYTVGGKVTEVTEEQSPIFEVWMDGNKPDDENSVAESITVQDDINEPIKISAKAGLNVKLSKGDLTQKWSYIQNEGTDEAKTLNGYYLNYGIAVGIAQEENDNLTDLRGIIYPEGEVSIDLDLNYMYSSNGEWIPVDENTEGSLGPANGAFLVAYSLNGEKNENFWPRDSIMVGGMPNGERTMDSNNPDRSVYDSGDFTIVQNGSVLTITFKDFKLDGTFPTKNRGGGNFGSDKEGYFSVGNIELFVPYYKQDSNEVSEYQFDIQPSEIRYKTSQEAEGIVGTNEDGTLADNKLSDNKISYSMTKALESTISTSVELRNDKNQLIEDANLRGNGIRGLGDDVIVRSNYNAYDGPFEGGTERLITWDGNMLDIEKYSDTSWYKISESSGLDLPFASQENIEVKYGIYILDRNKGLTTDEQINQTDKDNFEWYNTAEEAMQKGKIAAVYMNDPDYRGYRNSRTLELKFKVTNEEQYIGQVAAIRHKVKLYSDSNREKLFNEVAGTYNKTKYTKEGAIKNYHTPSNIGNSILIVANKVNVSNTTTDIGLDGTPRKNYDVEDGLINFSITPTLTNEREMSEGDSFIDTVTVTNYLPKGLTYKVTSANKEPASVTVDPDTGVTTIVWEYHNWQVNREAPEYPVITFTANIDSSLENNTQLENKTVIYTENDYRDEAKYRTAIYGVLISNLTSLQATKEIEKPIVEINENLKTNLVIYNTSEVQLKNVRALEVLPYNGDENGSDFVGTYDVKMGEIPEGVSVYYTQISVGLLESQAGVSRDDYDKLNPANINFEKLKDVWKEVNSGDVLTDATAIVLVKDVIESKAELNIAYEILPKNNQPLSKYVVSANVIATGFPTVLKSNIEIGTVVQRRIEGTVWQDANIDGLMEDSEAKLDNITVEVLDSKTNEQAKDVNGKTIAPVVTNENGEYAFTGLVKGKYKIRFTLPDNTYVTEKKVGTNDEINSKANTEVTDGKVATDELTKLNADALESLEKEEHINLGLVGETGKVIIKYLEKHEDTGTGEIVETEIAPQEEITGPIDANFDISNKEKDIANYQRTDEDFTKTGIFTEEDQIIKIYYEKIPAGITVKHVLVNNDSSETMLDVEHFDGVDGEQYTTSRKDYPNYQPATSKEEPTNATGEYIAGQTIEVIYYYERIPAGNVTVRYVTKVSTTEGNVVEVQLENPTVLEGYVGEKFTASRIEISGYYADSTETDPPAEGTFTKDSQELKYYYTKPTSLGVEVQYLTIQHNDETGMDEEVQLAEPTFLNGDIGEEYRTTRKPIDHYRAVEPEPTNAVGTFSDTEKIIVKYYYELIPKATVTVYHLDEFGHNMKTTNDNGEEVEVEPIVMEDYVGAGYDISSMRFEGYSVIDEPDNRRGTFTETPTTVVFVYGRNTYKYRVEYYFEGLDGEYEIDNALTENSTAKYKDIITNYDKKEKTGFTYKETTGVPLTIGVNENNNVIKLYYTRNTYDYRIEYYYEDDEGNINQDIGATERNNTEYGASITEFKDKNRAGYYLAKKDNYPLVITENSDNNVMKIYYYKQEAKVVVRYVDEDTKQEISGVNRETVNGKVGLDYDVTDKVKEIDGYVYRSSSDNTTGKYLEDASTNNTITVTYYYKKTSKVITRYVEIREQEKKDEEGNPILDPDTNKPVTEKVEVEISDRTEVTKMVGEEVAVFPKAITNYTLLSGQEPKNITVTRNDQTITYYYTGQAGGVIERHIDDVTGDIIEEKVHAGRQGDHYKIDSKTFEGYDLVAEKNPTNSEGSMQEDTIEVNYYYKKKATVIIEYRDEISGEKIVINDEDFTEQLYGHESDEYTSEQKDLEGYIFTKLDGESSGLMSVDVILDQAGNKVFDNVTTIVYYYKHIAGGVVERHIDEITGEIIEENRYEGKVQDPYVTTNKNFTGYDLVEDKLPENSTGEMTLDEIVVNYYYIKQAKVEIKYVDKATNQELLKKEVLTGHENDPYTSESKEIEYYRLIEEPSNKEGKMSATVTKNEDGTFTVNNVTEVIYYYEKLNFNFKIDNTITKLVVNGEDRTITDGKLEKIEMTSKEIKNSEFEVTYKITVTNDSEIDGEAYVSEQIPEGLELASAKGWDYVDGKITIKTPILKPGETAEYEVVLKWRYNDSNVGTKLSRAEIYATRNDANFEETTKEDNISDANIIVTISTGKVVRNVTGIIIILAILAIIIKNMKHKTIAPRKPNNNKNRGRRFK